MSYPTAKDDSTSLPNPSGTDKQNSPDHGALHTSENQAIIALESKLGTGATVPASNTLLLGTGAGTSAWSAATSAQLAASVSDETGSGSLVFAITPTLVTPKVDTINEATGGNGVTVSSVNVKSGVVTGVTTLTTSGNATVGGNAAIAGTASVVGQLSVQTATAPPAAGAATAGIKMSSTANLGLFFGSGAPTFSAAQGSLYMRTDGSSTSTRMYINTNGSTTWTNVTTAA